MYKPPQNTNRVQSLKNKFESLESKKSHVPSKQNENNLIRSTNQELPTLQRQISDPLKMNIKRTPAFRVEKSIVENGLQRCCLDKSDILESKMRLYTTIKNNCDNSNSLEKNDERKEVTSDKLTGSSKTCKNYHKLQSISEKHKSFDNDSLQLNNVAFEVENGERIMSNLYTQPIPKALRSNFIHNNREKELCDINTHGKFEENENISSELLTDTIKIALKKPLPQGPAPRKPPRTFQHFQKQSDTKNNFSVVLPSIKNIERGSNSKNEMKNKKTDAKYMLNKLEYALKNNRLNVKQQYKKTDMTANSGEDSDDGILCQHDFTRARHDSYNNEENLNSTFNLNCLRLMNCSKSECEINQPIYDETDYLLKNDESLIGKNRNRNS